MYWFVILVVCQIKVIIVGCDICIVCKVSGAVHKCDYFNGYGFTDFHQTYVENIIDALSFTHDGIDIFKTVWQEISNPDIFGNVRTPICNCQCPFYEIVIVHIACIDDFDDSQIACRFNKHPFAVIVV